MAEIRWTEEAYRWLKDIFDYIDLNSHQSAVNVVNGIYQKVQMLKQFPETGYKFRDEPDGSIRILLYGHYRIAYLLKDKNHIDILGIFHGALDIDEYLL